MPNETELELHSKLLTDFHILRIIRAREHSYSEPITAFLSDVFIHANTAVGVVYGHVNQGPHGRYADEHLLRTSDTHHAPTLEHVGDDLPEHLVAAYANDWPELLGKADLWVYGHTHVAADFFKHRCRIVSNPRGYPGQTTGFDPNFLIEL